MARRSLTRNATSPRARIFVDTTRPPGTFPAAQPAPRIRGLTSLIGVSTLIYGISPEGLLCAVGPLMNMLWPTLTASLPLLLLPPGVASTVLSVSKGPASDIESTTSLHPGRNEPPTRAHPTSVSVRDHHGQSLTMRDNEVSDQVLNSVSHSLQAVQGSSFLL